MDCEVMQQTCQEHIHFPMTLEEHGPYYVVHGDNDAAPGFRD